MRLSRFLPLVCLALLGACGKKEGHGKAHGEDHAPVPHHVSAALPSMPAEAEIAALFDRWNETLQTGGPHDMAMLYAERGVLLPTVSNQPRNNRAEIADYFTHFQALSPKGTINKRFVTVLDSNTAVDTGIYTFDLMRDGRPDSVTARYSFVYEKTGGHWEIVSHHSSAMPEPVPGRLPSLADRSGQRVRYAAEAAARQEAAPVHKTSLEPDHGHGGH